MLYLLSRASLIVRIQIQASHISSYIADVHDRHSQKCIFRNGLVKMDFELFIIRQVHPLAYF